MVEQMKEPLFETFNEFITCLTDFVSPEASARRMDELFQLMPEQWVCLGCNFPKGECRCPEMVYRDIYFVRRGDKYILADPQPTGPEQLLKWCLRR